ncbi:hypothetical protein Godav_024773, partial [Gossypium davidsonii]|nr:hypothetical protein [Gossypium davidsonii]
MGESGGDNREQRDEISFLSEELIQLSVKGSRVVPDDKPTLICTIWIGQNLYLIVFELEEDLEVIMEGRPWLFRKSLILFDRLTQSVERSQICLNSFPVWLKIGPCLPEFDKKDLLHTIGVTFGGKPLRRGIFVSLDNKSQRWISFKYEKLPLFCFGCGRLGHEIPDCVVLSAAEKSKVKDDPPFTMALKAESNLVGKEVIQFNDLSKKDRAQVSYTGDSENGRIVDIINGEANNFKEVLYGRSEVGDEEKMLKNQVDVAIAISDEKMVDNTSSPVINSNSTKKMSWKRIAPGQRGTQRVDENGNKKRKATEGILEIFNVEDDYGDGIKRQKKEQEKDLGDMLAETM